MWPDNRLRALLGIDLPIIQAPMAGSSSLEMAVAVSEAGGLGSLACAAMDASAMREMMAAARARTSRPFAVNVFVHAAPDADDARDAAWLARLAPYYRELGVEPPDELSGGAIRPFDDARCAVIEDLAPAVVSFHFGLPAPELVRRVKATGAKVLSTATTVEEARWLADHGCDAVIAQGSEAGGHRGMFLTADVHTQIGTFALVPQVADAVAVPVVAAGGVADGRSVAAAFALGAAGVQLGTAFLFTAEATLGDAYRAALNGTQGGDTALTNVFSGRPTRCLVNRVMRETGPMADGVAAFPKGFAAMAPLRAAAESRGDRDFSAHYCGQAAGLGRRASAGQLTRDLAADALSRLGRLSGSG